jgi:hypothetical protein
MAKKKQQEEEAPATPAEDAKAESTGDKPSVKEALEILIADLEAGQSDVKTDKQKMAAVNWGALLEMIGPMLLMVLKELLKEKQAQ